MEPDQKPKTIREDKVDNILNKAAFWIWPYVILLIALSIYPLFYLIDISIVSKIISTEFALNLATHFQVVVLVVSSFLIYPVTLLLLDIIPFIFIKSKESKKVYKILSLIFLVSFLVSFIICLIQIVIKPLA